MDENGLNVESERDGTQLSETGKMERVRERKRARESEETMKLGSRRKKVHDQQMEGKKRGDESKV